MRIGTVEFRTKEEYKAGQRDATRIELLKEKADINNPQVAAAMYRRLKSQPFYFESEVGREFVKELGRGIRPGDRGVGTGIRHEGYRETPEEAERIRAYEESRRQRAAAMDEEDDIPRGRSTYNTSRTSHSQIRRPERIQNDNKLQNAESKQKKNKKRLNLWLVSLGIVSAIVLAYCVSDEVIYQVKSYQSEQKMAALQSSVLQPVITVSDEGAQILDRIAMADASGGVLGDTVTESDSSRTITLSTETAAPTCIPEYSALYRRNNDMIGWIEIPGTVVNYPVMQKKTDSEYYLRRDFDGAEDVNGLPFLDARSDVLQPTTNLLVYGHCMKNGSMFATLMEYKDKGFYEEHPLIRFDSIYEKAEYEIIAVFQSRVAYVDEETFRYYSFIQAEDEQDFDRFVSAIKEMSYYETGKTAQYGDTLLTLSTCDKEIEDGRLVVVARKREN